MRKKRAGKENGGKKKRGSELLLAEGGQGNLYKVHGRETEERAFTSHYEKKQGDVRERRRTDGLQAASGNKERG